jgi:hypothetical protein
MTVSAKVDLRHLFGPIRDQGVRPTCLAFAASDSHAALRSPWADLSCEYAFYHAQRRAKRLPTDGAQLSHMLDALRDDGQPPEASWSYLAKLPANSNDWMPPAGVTPLFRRAGERRPAGLNEIVGQLDRGKPTIILMKLSRSFYLAGSALVVESTATEQPDPLRRHAVIAVGYGEWNSKQAVLIRNSWGKSWGHGGYAWLAKEYLVPRLFDLAIIKEDLSVSPSTVAA